MRTQEPTPAKLIYETSRVKISGQISGQRKSQKNVFSDFHKIFTSEVRRWTKQLSSSF